MHRLQVFAKITLTKFFLKTCLITQHYMLKKQSCGFVFYYLLVVVRGTLLSLSLTFPSGGTLIPWEIHVSPSGFSLPPHSPLRGIRLVSLGGESAPQPNSFYYPFSFISAPHAAVSTSGGSVPRKQTCRPLLSQELAEEAHCDCTMEPHSPELLAHSVSPSPLTLNPLAVRGTIRDPLNFQQTCPHYLMFLGRSNTQNSF